MADVTHALTGGYTLEWLLDALVRAELCSSDVAAEVRVKAGGLGARIQKEKTRVYGAVGKSGVYEVTPAEIVAEYGVPLEDGPLSEDQIMEILAQESGHPYHKIDPLTLDARLITETLSRPFARRHVVLPLWRKDGRMTVAVDNPYNLHLLDQLRTITGSPVDVVVSAKTDILKLVREVYGFRATVHQAAEEFDVGVDLGNLEQFMRLRPADEIEATDQHIVNAVDYLLHYALEHRASDIHLEPKREHLIARMRIDGVLHTVHKMPRVVHPAITSRVKSLARMDIAEKRRPQDGRIKTMQADREVELRISTMPVAFGEKVVIRIFDPRILLQDLGSLGFFPEELATFQGFVQRPHGIVLVTGPTGSGKTTTLYSALRTIATPEVNVVTIEDPIEMVVEEFNQVAVQPKAGITFASALRTILRQDPDVIMVGEIRDRETAEHAIQAALTGHLVLSTIHTNDSAGAITRLLDLGIEPFLVASTLVGVVAQRLVRVVCNRCKRRTLLTRDQCVALHMQVPEGRAAPELPVWEGEGCVHCRHTGLRGRAGVYEVLPVGDRVRRLITEKKDAAEIMRAARMDGMLTLREGAIKKMAQGMTTFGEVVRITAEH
ncbi:MAG: general secretion pathway protein GspE [Myxococcales bacterium]